MISELRFAQAIIRCPQCETGSELRCITCEIDLCSGCASTHSRDNSKTHQLVAVTSSNTSEIIRKCSVHEGRGCEIFCKDCDIPICTKCVVSLHRQHDFLDLEDFLIEKRKEILEEINKIKRSKLLEIQRQKSRINEEEYEEAIEAVFSREDEICSAVRDFGSKLRERITQHKLENQEKGNKIKFTEESILKSIAETKAMIESNDSKAILQFNGIKVPKVSLPPIDELIPQPVVQRFEDEDITSLFGHLSFIKGNDDTKNVEDEPFDVRGAVEEQAWFHGFIPREEAELLVQKFGDFLVREKDDDAENHFIITCFPDGPKHVIITPENIKKLGPYGTIVKFVEDLQLSKGRISHPIPRQNSQLDYDKISMGSNLEEAPVYKSKVSCQGIYRSQSVLIERNDGEIKEMFKNITFLRQFKHQNIVRLIGFSAVRRPVLLVMENLSGGSLLSYIRKNGSSITVRKRMEMCGDVVNGMKYLQEKKCIHRDIAARNCFVSPDAVVKISNFWIAEFGEKVKNADTPLPIKWTAPEAFDSGFSTGLSDVWSFGILMWEIFSFGQLPYTGMTNQKTVEKINKGYRMPAPDGTPKVCSVLMSRCWEQNPSSRYNVDKIMNKIQKAIKDIKRNSL